MRDSSSNAPASRRTPCRLTRLAHEGDASVPVCAMIADPLLGSAWRDALRPGELGLGDKEDRSSWTKVTNLTGRAIQVQCGLKCSAVLTTSGVFTMGYNFGGATPQLVKLASVADISLTWRHILALTSNGELYAWGRNEQSQCGIEASIDQNLNSFY